MTQACFAIPGDLNTPTGGYVYDRQIMALLPSCGVAVRHLMLPEGFPSPSAGALDETGRMLASVPANEVLVIDGLALGVLPPGLLEPVIAPIIALHHHPLGLESGITPQESEKLLASEKAATGFARRVIVTSQTTAKTLAELGFAPPPPVSIAIPGIAGGTRSKGSADGFAIISVGTIIPRKGYDILVAALARLHDEPWHCTIAGGMDRDTACVNTLRAQIAEAGLEGRIRFTDVLGSDAIDALLSRSDLFALPSRYEGYGMAFAEAMAHGLPILATSAPAIPGTVPPEAGILVEPDNAEAFAGALLTLMRDPALRRRLGDGAWAHAQTLPRWEDTAGIIARIIKEVADEQLLG